MATPNDDLVAAILADMRDSQTPLSDLSNQVSNEKSHTPGQKWLGHLSCITYPPSPLINVGKYRVFFQQKGKGKKNHLIIKIESGGSGELTPCLNYFVWDCSPDSDGEISASQPPPKRPRTAEGFRSLLNRIACLDTRRANAKKSLCVQNFNTDL